MEKYLDDLFQDGSEREVTLKARKGFLMSLAKLFPGSTDLSFLKKGKKVLERVNDSKHPGTRYGRMVHIIKAINAHTEPIVSKKTRDRYVALITRLKPQKQALSDNNVMSEEQKHKYLTHGQLNAILERKLVDLFEKYGMKRKITTDDIRRLKVICTSLQKNFKN
jgi:predicted transcriptional regulator